MSCDFPTETESWIEEKYSWCLIDSDGKKLKVLKEDTGSGGSLYFISNDTEILNLGIDSFYRMYLDSSDTHFYYRFPFERIGNAKLSPNRKRIIFVALNDEGEDLYLVDVDGSNIRRLTYTSNTDKRYPSFSHDGEKITYINFIWDDQKVEEQNLTIFNLADDSETVIDCEKNIQNSNYHVLYSYPCFTHNDAKIAYIKNNKVNSIGDSLFVIDVDGTNNTLIDDHASWLSPISISSNSNRLAYFRYENGCGIASINDDGSDFTEIDNNVSTYCKFEISNNGEKIIIWNRKSEKALYIVNTDGTNWIKLASAIRGTFSLDDKKVACIGYNKIVHN